MTNYFGEQLRKLRKRSYDCMEGATQALTQSVFVEQLKKVVGLIYSHAAVSNWERGRNKISHEDLLNPVTMEMIKSSFNIILKEEQMKVELSSKLDGCSEEKLRQLLKTIDERMGVILNDSMVKIEELS